jgi:hypothetical protein
MLNKILLSAFASSLIFLFIFPLSTLAQDINYDKAYSNYAQSFIPYEEARREYILARSQYLQFNTLKSKNDAREATHKMLAARDDVVISYLIALRERIRENPGVDENVESFLFVRIDQEIDWFREHKMRLASAETPEDLVADSDSAKRRYEDMDILLYEALIINSQGKVKDYVNRSTDNFSLIKNLIDEIKLETRDEYILSSDKLQKIDGWLIEAENRIVRAREKTDEAFEEIAKMGGRQSRNPRTNYDAAGRLLEEANQYLRRSLLFMREVIKEVKTK